MLNNKSFCIKPWVHACIRTNGNITLCCQSNEIPQHNLKTSSIDEWWTSNFLSEIRTKILNGEEVSSCVACYEIEKNGSVSLRQKSNQEYKIFEQYAKKTLDYYKYPHEQPIELELQLTNLCNLKCLMCKEEDSSSFAVENKKLKISVIDQNDYKVDEVEIKQIKEWIKTSPKLINLRGGEPFIVPEIKELLKWAIDHKLLENTEVHITTNGTSLDNEWETILRSLPKLRIMVSIDAKGKLNDYIRYGSNWDIIVTNLQILESIPNINLFIHATVQNLNILYFDQLIVWCKEKNYFLDFDVLSYPFIYKIHNLPQQLIDKAKLRLQTINDNTISKELIKILEMEKSTNFWEEFKTEITLRDSIRKISINDYIPELSEHWHAEVT